MLGYSNFTEHLPSTMVGEVLTVRKSWFISFCMTTLSEKTYRTILREELEARCERNPRYSLRAFARDLGVTSSRLSEVMGGRYGLSREAAHEIAKKLSYNDEECRRFCDLVDAQHARAQKDRRAAKARLDVNSVDYQQLTLDSFQVISDWYHYAILELTLVQDYEDNIEWMARRLGISPHIVSAAVERLQRLDLLTVQEGVLKASDGFTATPSGIPSDALKKFHRQLLEKALISIDLQNVEERDLSHMILAVNSKDIPEAKEEIKTFRRKFDARFGAAIKKDEVYCLGIQFFRLQEKNP
jgi:uncharacterized protein (TIGR02147 family)